MAGFFFRIKDFEKFNDIIMTKLSDKFDKNFIIKNFNWIKISKEYEKIILNTVEEFNNANF